MPSPHPGFLYHKPPKASCGTPPSTTLHLLPSVTSLQRPASSPLPRGPPLSHSCLLSPLGNQLNLPVTSHPKLLLPIFGLIPAPSIAALILGAVLPRPSGPVWFPLFLIALFTVPLGPESQPCPDIYLSSKEKRRRSFPSPPLCPHLSISFLIF